MVRKTRNPRVEMIAEDRVLDHAASIVLKRAPDELRQHADDASRFLIALAVLTRAERRTAPEAARDQVATPRLTPPGDAGQSITDRDLLKAAADALWACAKSALTVKPVLDVPYPDEPGSTPYTRWVERSARRAHDLAMIIRKRLKEGSPDGP